MFNKSFANMRRDLSSGQGIGVSIFSGNSVTKNDVQHIRDFDTAMKNGSTTAQAWQKHMTGCTVAAKQQAKQCLINKGSLTELANGLQQTTVKAKLATVGLKALSVAGNMLLMWGISLAINGIIKGFDALITTTEEHQEQLQNLQQEYDEAKQNLEDVNSQISEYEKRINELQGKTLTPVEEEELQRIQNLNEQLKIEKEVLEEIERIKKGETSGKAIETINSKKGGMTRMEMIEDYAHSGYVNTQKEIDRIMSADYMTSEEKNYEIKYLREHQDSLRQQALEISSELLEEAKALDQNDAEAKELYDKIQALSAETLTWAKDVDTATNSVNENSNATSNASENANKMTVSLSEMKTASDNISALSSAFKQLSDDGYMSTESMAKIQDATKLSGDEWDKYQNKLMSAKAGSIEFNQAMSELTYKILDNTFAGKDLTDVTEERIAAVLRENGVLNANAVARDYLAVAKANEALATYDGTQASYENAAALLSECGSADIAQQAMANLQQAQNIFNNSSIDISQKVAALVELGQYANWTAAQLASVTNTTLTYSDGKWWVNSYAEDADGNGELDYLGSEEYHGFDFKPTTYTIPRYSGGSGGGGKVSSSGSDNKPDYEDPTEAIINRINLRSKELEQQEEYIQNALEIAEIEKDYEKQISLTNDKLATQKQRVDALKIANAGLHQMAEDLRNSTPQWNEEGWFDSQGNETESYNTLYNNSSKEEQEKLKKQFEKISKIKEAWKNNAEEIVGINKEILQTENDLWDTRRQVFDDRLEESEYYIEHSNNFGWENGDNEIKARKRVLDWIQSDYYRSLIKDDEEYYKILEEHRLNYIEALKDEFDKAIDFASKSIDSSKTLLQSYYDVTNSIAEAQHEITKELEASKTMYEYLNEDTRKLLFNQEDYNILSSKLLGIQEEANALQDRYNNDILNATAENLDEITSKYEMQYETLMKSYEIAKADLEIAKKKQKLNNVLAEKNVKMLINGQWIWVANTQDVIDAQSELADAEYARQTEAAGLRQTNSLNDLTAQQDKLGTVMNKLEKGILGAVESISMLPVAIQDVVIKLQSDTLSASNTLDSYSRRGSSSLSADYVSWAKSQMDANSAAWHGASPSQKTALEKANQSLGAAIGSTYDSASGTWKHKYATGTKHTLPGSALMGEIEPEMYIDNNGYLIPINQPTLFNDIGAGGIVFNQAQMENMRSPWDLSNVNTSNISSVLTDRVTSDGHGGGDTVLHGDIIVNNPRDYNEFVRELTKAFKRRTVN